MCNPDKCLMCTVVGCLLKLKCYLKTFDALICDEFILKPLGHYFVVTS